jgi:ABC-type transporter MlaC component
MTAIRRILVLVGILALSGAVGRPAAADQAGDQLRSRIDRVVAILDDPILKVRPEERRVALREASTDVFDFTEITRRALGRHWQTATAGERQELVQLFSPRGSSTPTSAASSSTAARGSWSSGSSSTAIWRPCGPAW